MEKRTLDKNSIKGTMYVLLSAICFSTGGVLIKSIPWSSFTIQGLRSVFSFLVIGAFMLVRRQKFVWNRTVFFGAVCNTVMSLAFVAATKMTTAANAIVLQFTEPVFVILLMWTLYKKKPGKDAVIACFLVFTGILCFFLESLSAGGMAGNLLAILSGLTYALVMMQKGFKGADFESSLMVSNVMSVVIGIPAYLVDQPFGPVLNIWRMSAGYGLADSWSSIWLCMVLLGVFQYGFSYIFLSKGLDHVSPVTASLTSTIEPILNPLLVAAFYGETVGAMAIIGAVLVVGSATFYNVRKAIAAEPGNEI